MTRRRPISLALGAVILSSLVWSALSALRMLCFAAGPGDRRRLVVALAVSVMLGAVYRYGRPRLRKAVLLVAVWLVVIEATLQALAWMCLLPGLNLAAGTPYARVYWTVEGCSNSMMNRFGWHYPDRPTDSPEARRIVLIGDSFIEALQVSRGQHMGVSLERRLDDAGEPSTVLAVGRGGWGPAQYRELARYALARLHPDELVVFLFLGNDFVDSATPMTPDAQRSIRRDLDANHESLWLQLPVVAESQYLTGKIIGTIDRRLRDRLSPTERAPAPAGHTPNASLARLGLMDLYFRRDRPEPAQRGFATVIDIMGRMRDEAEAHGASILFVTIPIFSETFYRQTGSDWTTEEGELDLLLPEQVLARACRDGELLPMGAWLKKRGLTVAQVRELYLRDGVGHLSPAGHALWAEALSETLQRQRR